MSAGGGQQEDFLLKGLILSGAEYIQLSLF